MSCSRGAAVSSISTARWCVPSRAAHRKRSARVAWPVHRITHAASRSASGGLIEDRYLAVEHQRLGLEACHRNSHIVEALHVVYTSAADEPDAGAVLVGDDPPAVDLLLVDPAGAVQGIADERGVDRTAENSSYFLCLAARTSRQALSASPSGTLRLCLLAFSLTAR